MNKLPVVLVLAASLSSCAPLLTTSTPVKLTNTVSYTTGILKLGEDNPVLAAIVAIAPTAPFDKGRQPWRAEEIERNSVVLRSHPTMITSSFSLANIPQEMSWNVISASGVTTVTATYSSAYAATVDYIFSKLDAKFSRVK